MFNFDENFNFECSVFAIAVHRCGKVQLNRKSRTQMSNTSKSISVLTYKIIKKTLSLLARDVIYTCRAYAMMSVSICLSVTEVNWRIIVNLGFKFRYKFTAHCHCGEGSSQQHLVLC